MKINHFADLHLGVESYGKTDPSSGLSSRMLDILASFDQLVDYAIENKVDLVLFCGDAYKSRDPSQTQQREFAKRIKRLSENGVSVFLLIGNHDLPNAIGRATTTEIFNTLAVKNVHVANHPDTHKIQTPAGEIQIVALPWLRRSFLLAKEDSKNLNFDELNQQMQQKLTNIIDAEAEKLNSTLPSILAAHVWVTGAKIGSEDYMTIGQEHVLLPSNVANPAFDYIALGHIHRHQVLSEEPPIVYAGSLDRLDFGDEGIEKGFCVVDIEAKTDKRKVSYRFQPLNGRRFVTVRVDIDPQNTEPTETILKAIAEQDIDGAIVRLQVTLPQELEGQIRDGDIRDALKKASYYTVAKDIRRESRTPRLGDRTAEEITPFQALEAYLKSINASPERTKTLLEYGERLIRENQEGDNGALPKTTTHI
ncbi:MAG TPA: exonuclease SbcCD subunit D [Dehalococcoidia bacterium]|nr:exonuclease SbcCD subunit D [Dehalococcoidia bacterium]